MTVAGKSTAGQEGADSGIRYRYPGRADHPAGQALEEREREKCRTGPLQRAHPQPPPPRFPNASRHPLRGVGSDNMIPAPVRSVPPTDRWCLRLLTIMQRDCDTSISLWRRSQSLREGCEWVRMPIMGRRRFLNSANQRLRTLGNVGVVNVTAIRHIEGVVSTNIAAGPEAAIINGVPVAEPKGLARPPADGDRGPGHTRRAAEPTLRPRVRPVRPRVVAAGEGGPAGSAAAGRFSRLGLSRTRSGGVPDTGSTGCGRRIGTVGGWFGHSWSRVRGQG